MKTQLLLRFKPVRGLSLPTITSASVKFVAINEPLLLPPTVNNFFSFRSFDNKNWGNDIASTGLRKGDPRLVAIDIYEDIPIPMNYTILDVREPEKRKTNFSKTIRIPGTKNNNKIFNHIYEISSSSKFNPNLRTSVIIIQDGVQVVIGNMQLKRIIVVNNDYVEYDVFISGDFTSIFADMGNSKLSDLDLSEWAHKWDKANIVNSWTGAVQKNGTSYSNYTYGSALAFNNIERNAPDGRIKIETTASHGLAPGDWIRIDPANTYGSYFVKGEWQVVEVINATTITINHPYPDGLYSFTIAGSIRKAQPKGEGYVYPMISTGDDFISPAPIFGQESVPIFPVTNFVMGFYVKELWDKIFKLTNSRYESNFLNSDFFKRLIIWQKKTVYELDSQVVRSREFKVANISEPQLRIAGFGTNATGTYAGTSRSFPGNLLTTEKYPFPASISASAGLLYNGINGTEPFNFPSNRWKVSDNGKYTINFFANFRLEASISDYLVNGSFVPPVQFGTPPTQVNYYWGGIPNAAYDEDVELTVKMIKRSNGLNTVINQQIISLRKTNGVADPITKTTYRDWKFAEKAVNLRLEDYFLQKDDLVFIEVWYNSNIYNDTIGAFTQVSVSPPQFPWQSSQITTAAYRGIIDIKTAGVQFFIVEANKQLSEGSNLDPSLFLPKDMTCKDFFLSIIKHFNLYIESDNNLDKNYYIEPRNDYYKDGSGGIGDYVDWTNKVDTNSIELIPMGELNAKFYSFNYKPESDYWNKRYKEDVGIGYGDFVMEIENDFLSNENKITSQFGASPMINSPSDSDIVIPQVVQRDSDGGNKPINTATKLLTWGGIRPNISNGFVKFWWLQKSIGNNSLQSTIFDLYTYYPYAGTVDSPFDPVWDLNWYYTEYVFWNRAKWTNENLYNKYWAGFIEEISDPDSKLVKANLLLTAKDINNLDFKKIYVINGNYLRLQKIIDYDANSNRLTACEFLKLKSPSKFKRKSIVISEIDLQAEIINTNSMINIKSITADLPPVNYKSKYQTSNYSDSGLTAQYNPNINGQNNILGVNSTNISIQGDENYVGSNSNNITISGNGVFVSGGLRNVSVIGTDKVFIDKSDMTYINGVRYINGVPVSRANVVDAGLNAAVIRNSNNTVSNVVDAGEDIVIDWGSNTYEDVIDAGLDRILPDVNDYGVTTENTPISTINYAGNLINSSKSLITLPQLIKERIDPVPYAE